MNQKYIEFIVILLCAALLLVNSGALIFQHGRALLLIDSAALVFQNS